MHRSKHKQQGVAGILFTLLLLGMIGFLALATDGARALQTRARLDNASEVASIAVAALNDANIDSEGPESGSKVNRDLVKDYAKAYVPYIDSFPSLKIIRLDCENVNSNCLGGLVDGFQYQINISTTQQSWFKGTTDKPKMDQYFTTSSGAISQKDQSPADVVIVADFSGSMNYPPNGSYGESKLQILKQVIAEVAKELTNTDPRNTLGFTAFDNYTRTKTSYGTKAVDNLVYRNNARTELDVNGTINDIFTEDKYELDGYYGYYYDIPSTQPRDVPAIVDSFRAGGSTASFQGVIRGAQLLNDINRNKRKIMIIISDGDDNGNPPGRSGNVYKTWGEELMDTNQGNMCQTIRNTFDSNGYETTMAYIGFSTTADTTKALGQCVGANNIYEADDGQTMVNEILGIINEETGHLRKL
ncbi:VWA domain-containing protein [Vibrio sp. S4M6]|uniref:pilus assembly protein TadG-related protein n=1 Tax=Vibrio sinus TaxID=2946865 RepID=UPI002029D6D7|nr:pilus assembly protein TadG-related protein [Vibrio sinus]MCL9780806.1 VWA domain-containing protein [Vibrio sinus]